MHLQSGKNGTSRKAPTQLFTGCTVTLSRDPDYCSARHPKQRH